MSAHRFFSTLRPVPQHRLLASGLCLCLLASILPASAQQSLANEAFYSPSALLELPTEHWRTNGGNLKNQRFSPLTQIDKDNVAQLKGEWMINLGSATAPKNSGEA